MDVLIADKLALKIETEFKCYDIDGNMGNDNKTEILFCEIIKMTFTFTMFYWILMFTHFTNTICMIFVIGPL